MSTLSQTIWAVHTIATHVNPHVDEITGIWLLRKFGSKHFSGINTAKVEFWGDNSNLPKTSEEYLSEGVLLIGIGGGMFDEHPTLETERKEKQCAATLIAEYLGVVDDPALEHILSFVRQNDLNGTGSMFDIASVCRKMYAAMSPEKVILWATLALEAVFTEQTKFTQEAQQEFREKTRILSVRDGEKVLKVAVIESDNEVVAKFARAARGGDCAVVVQKNSAGNVQIFSNRRYGIDLRKTARFIRLAEQKAKRRVITLDRGELEAEGVVSGAEEWHFFKKGQMLLNGSLSHPNVPPTKLTLQRISEIVCNCCI